jgi:hypothetical protein
MGKRGQLFLPDAREVRSVGGDNARQYRNHERDLHRLPPLLKLHVGLDKAERRKSDFEIRCPGLKKLPQC